MGDYLTVQDIALKLDVKAETIRRWLRTGKLKGTPLGRAGYRIHENDFQLFMCRGDESRRVAKKQRPSSQDTYNSHITSSCTFTSTDDLPSFAYQAIFVRDPMSVITAWNQEATQLYGWGEQEALGQISSTFLQTTFPISREETERQLIQTGQWEGELHSVDRQGQKIIIASRQILRRNAQGQAVSILEIDRDITAHKQAEVLAQELETRQQFVALTENSSDSITMISMQNQIIYINQAGCDLFSIQQSAEAHSASILTYVPESKRSFLQEIIFPEVKTHGRWGGDFELLNSQTGAIIDVRLTIFLVPHPRTQTPLGLALVARDIHEQKELERRKDAFTSMASHELRSPLTTIQANLQLAERRIQSILQTDGAKPEEKVQAATSDVLQMLDRARRQAKVMNRLIGDLLDSTRIQANKLNLALAEHDLVAIMRNTIINQLEITPRRIIRLAPPPDEQDIIVLADKDRIEQVLGNYLSNALKYSAASQEVAIGLNIDGDNVRVWVRDHGPGLTDEQQKHIWDRYYQAKDITVQSGSGIGLGLGLHICKTLISRHGGEVGVESAKGSGSTFWFHLPLANTLYTQ